MNVINKSKHALPEYETPHAAGLDIRANLESAVCLRPGERRLIPTGLFVELPVGFEAQLRPRSGLAIRHGISLVNSPGTIDSDYRGEIKVVMINLSNEPFSIADGERICQMVVARHERVEWSSVDELNDTTRGDGGFGHTGV